MKRFIALAIVVAALSSPSAAAAQTASHSWFASPFIGTTFSGDTTRSAPVYGASGGWMGGRIGFEGDVADSPDFFESTGFLIYRRVTTVMGNALSEANPFGIDLTRFEFWRASAGLVVKF